MDDLISRQAAIDAIMEEPTEVRYPVYYAEKIRQLTSAQPVTITEHESDLKLQKSNDTISRQAAIDAMCNACSDWCDEGVCKKVSAIGNLPSAQQWIPVSERLPKESDGKVLITVSGEVETGKYSEFSKTWFIGILNGVGGDAPIAWMPLPEPWKGEADES